MDKLVLRAMAKINLGLDVVGKRQDGYHEVRMVMQTVNLYDVLTLVREEEPGIRVTTDQEELPCDEHNLIYRAAKCVMGRCAIPGGVRFSLQKNIPIAAGMAGGSTDAAAAFVGMNRLYDLGLTDLELREMAVTVGADVPFCISGGTALAEGIGEVLTTLPGPPEAWLVIAKPDSSVSTKYVYESLDAAEPVSHADIEGMVEAIRRQELAGIAEKMENVLESVTAKAHPVIEEIKAFLREHGAANALMSGSGPTVFALFEKKETAQAAYEALKKKGNIRQIFLTTFADHTCVEEGDTDEGFHADQYG